MTQNATQAKKSRSFAEQSVFVSSIPSSMIDLLYYGIFLVHPQYYSLLLYWKNFSRILIAIAIHSLLNAFGLKKILHNYLEIGKLEGSSLSLSVFSSKTSIMTYWRKRQDWLRTRTTDTWKAKSLILCSPNSNPNLK